MKRLFGSLLFSFLMSLVALAQEPQGLRTQPSQIDKRPTLGLPCLSIAENKQRVKRGQSRVRRLPSDYQKLVNRLPKIYRSLVNRLPRAGKLITKAW